MERNYKAAMSKGETAPANRAARLIMVGIVLYSSRYARREDNKDSDNQWKIFLPAPQEMYFRITWFDFNVDGFQTQIFGIRRATNGDNNTIEFFFRPEQGQHNA